MLAPLPGLNQEELVQLLIEQYAAVGRNLEFMPVGEDSWAYRLGDLWVSIRRDLRGHVPASYEAARLLRRSGLDFVLAPVAGKDARVSRTFYKNSVVVFPYLAATEAPSSLTAAEMNDLTSMVSRLHEEPAPNELPVEDYGLPFDADLERALDAAHSGPLALGPYSLPAQQLIRRHAQRITALRDEFMDSSRICARVGHEFVLTHGEPGAGNVLRAGGQLLLADWGELMLGPPERDWYHLRRSFGLCVPSRSAFLRFYEIRWLLNELTEYTERFFAPHCGDSQDRHSWENLLACIAQIS